MTFLDLARTQHGLLTKRQVLDAGISLSGWNRACHDGRLELVSPGLARVDGFPETDHQRILAAVLQSGTGALASHRSALQLVGCSLATPFIDVLVEGISRPRPRPGVHHHRTRVKLDLDPSTRSGIACTSAPRALVDLGEVDEAAVFGAMADLAVSRLVSPTVAAATAERHSAQGRVGAAALKRALAEWPPGVEQPDSVFEVHLARLLTGHRLGGFRHHARICGFEVDFCYPVGLIVEADGFEFHRDRAAFDRDRRRDGLLAEAGWLVTRVTWTEFTNAPDRVVERVRRLIQRCI